MGNLRKSNFESLFNRFQNLLVGISADERNRQTLGTESTSTADTVKVRIGVGGKIVVNCQVDTLNIDTTAEDISGNTDALVEVLELLVAFDT